MFLFLILVEFDSLDSNFTRFDDIQRRFYAGDHKISYMAALICHSFLQCHRWVSSYGGIYLRGFDLIVVACNSYNMG